MKNFISIFILIASFAFSQTGYEIAKKVNYKQKPDDMKADLTMILTNTC